VDFIVSYFLIFQVSKIIGTLTVNNNEKVIPLNDFEVTGIQKKVQLLLDSSGAKIKPLKRRTVESMTEATRGIWSGLHTEDLFKI
jgi:large subunit ribosomal protein L43